jgi:hypothetical protein
MDHYLDPDVMATVAIRRDLQRHFLKADAVVGADRPLILFTQDIIKIFSNPKERTLIRLQGPAA